MSRLNLFTIRYSIVIVTCFALFSCKSEDGDDISLPVLTTEFVSEINSTSAASGGYINDDGGSPVIQCGLCWSTDPDPDTTDNNTKDSSQYYFKNTMEGLLPYTIYYVRAYACNANGISYGDELQFKTFKTNAIQVEGLIENYPIGSAFYYNDKLYFTASLGSAYSLFAYNVNTSENSRLGVYVQNYNALVVRDNKVYLSSEFGDWTNPHGSVSVFDISSLKETHFLDVQIATRDMAMDSQGNFYLIGLSKINNANSLYKFPVGDYSNPVVFMKDLGEPNYLVIKDDILYYSTWNSIFRINNQTSQDIYFNKSVSGFAITDDYLYYSDDRYDLIARVDMETLQEQVILKNVTNPAKMVYDETTKTIFVKVENYILDNKNYTLLKLTNIN